MFDQISRNVFWSQTRLFDPFLGHFVAQIAQNGPILFFCDFEAIRFPTRGHMPMFFGPKRGFFFTLFSPFIGPNSSKWAKIIFFRDSEAMRFPTRGHMPMFYRISFSVPKWAF